VFVERFRQAKTNLNLTDEIDLLTAELQD